MRTPDRFPNSRIPPHKAVQVVRGYMTRPQMKSKSPLRVGRSNCAANQVGAARKTSWARGDSAHSSIVTNPETIITNRVADKPAIGSRASLAEKGRRSRSRILSGTHDLMHCPHTRQSRLLLSLGGLSRLGQLRPSRF